MSIGRQRQNAIYSAGVFGRTPAVPTDFAELERRAKKAMGQRAWAYIGGGAGEGTTMEANRAAFDRWSIVPRVLRDVSQRNLSVELFGKTLAAPVLFSPVGAGELAQRDSDLLIGAAAAELGVPYILSNQGCSPMEETAAAMEAVREGAPRWFQLYWSTDDALVESLVRRAEECGADALVVTLDTTMLGWRPQDLNLGSLPFARGEGIAQYTSDPRFQQIVTERVAESAGTQAGPRPRVTAAAVAALVSMARHLPGGTWANLRSPIPRASVETFLDIYSRPSLNWDDIAGLCARTSLPVVLKGILHPDDARRAVDLGVDGILVSNHGGRQIDRSVASLDALVDIVDAVRGRAKVLLDSGIRTGADAYIALALGADAVCIGRPHMYGLAIAGQTGAREAVANIIAELDLTLGLSGQTDVADLTREMLRRRD
ncbi:alpha-hydroxy-acid oxidizing protein [Williamsia sp. CHRR-6]|uniref:alpha-hydroxy-acid oxidizing protein n=1 Tax=Williamsia sp. CHRR-6 TaxID=2835871 RepID=UPI001BD945E9|nr:alpha-hydroxy-acid oxidizing protein [Williamsia sp. CHRR-6]MBT0567352.1 alpha-hydroxy-acid oxidizing protein [Williamsia sp. CHRR-6]